MSDFSGVSKVQKSTKWGKLYKFIIEVVVVEEKFIIEVVSMK